MNKFLYWGFVFVCGLLTVACSDDDNTLLTVSHEDIQLDASGTEFRLEVNTTSRLWTATSTADWIQAERDSIYLIVKATSNPTKQPRSGKLYLVADDQYVRLWVSQEGSIRELGDPYPDAENPIGIIWKMTEGGKHGKILALDYDTCAWSKDLTTEHRDEARSATDGLANTKKMIEKYKDVVGFDTLYPAFHYIHMVKNKGDVDGGWYIPAFEELVELYATVTGNTYTPVPSNTAFGGYRHKIEVRERFAYWMQQAGGMPINFDGSYWSSTEYSKTWSKGCHWTSGTSWAHNTNGRDKNGTYFIRAIKDF